METLGELSHTLCLSINDKSHIADARRQVASLVHYGDFTESDNGRIALIITELATNILKHAGQGNILVQSVSSTRTFTSDGSSPYGLTETGADLIGLDIISIDNGKGMRDPDACIEDGYSTAGSQGTGLGAIMRQSDAFHTFSMHGEGSIIHARVIGERSAKQMSKEANEPRHNGLRITASGINVPYKDEDVSGDSWGCKSTRNGLAVMLADGIGHGQDAHLASRTAVDTFQRSESSSPSGLLGDVHDALGPTRGAATSVAVWSVEKETLTFCGIGNVSGSISDHHHHNRKMMTFNGTLGHNVGRYHDLNYPIAQDGVFVLHSDGLTANWSFHRYPGLAEMPAIVIAAVLFRDFSRRRDDACVVVVKMDSHHSTIPKDGASE